MFKKITEDAILPTRGSKYSACVDVYANEDIVIGAGETKLIGLGIAICEKILLHKINKHECNGNTDCIEWFMKNHYLQLMLRSSLGSKGLILPNGVGVNYTLLVDSDDSEFSIKKGDRIGQITLIEHKSYLFGIDTDIERDGGFGSTGK